MVERNGEMGSSCGMNHQPWAVCMGVSVAERSDGGIVAGFDTARRSVYVCS